MDLADHIYTLSTLEKEIENVDGLVPRYIKEVEAKNMSIREMKADDLKRIVELEKIFFITME